MGLGENQYALKWCKSLARIALQPAWQLRIITNSYNCEIIASGNKLDSKDIKNTDISKEVIAIDGKTARGSKDSFHNVKAIHLVSAWACSNQLVLGQLKVDDKSNEITAIPLLLDLLDIENCIITIDAMGTQTEIATKIIENKADYILALKGNQGNLQEEVESIFRVQKIEDQDDDIEKNRGRIESRTCQVIKKLEF